MQDRVALVTGGGSGIGAAICRALADAGARVAVTDRDGAAAQAVVDGLPAGRAIAIAADVTDAAAMADAVRACVAQFGALHLAANAAGIGAPRHDLADVPQSDWHRVIAINLTGVFHAMQAEIPAILASGGGAIVNIASICGLVAVAGSSAYTAAKHGVVGLTKAAALDYATRGIRINAIAPGFVDTPLLGVHDDDRRATLGALHPVNRLATADEIAATALFLLGPGAGFVTATVLAADGGLTAR